MHLTTTHRGTLRALQHIFDFSQQDYHYKYDLQLKCMLDCWSVSGVHYSDCWCYQFPLSQFSVRVTFHIFSENILNLTQACSSITFVLSQLFKNQISVFSGKLNCCRTNLHDARTTESMTLTPKIFIHQFSNFYIGEIYIYSATFTKIFMLICSVF